MARLAYFDDRFEGKEDMDQVPFFILGVEGEGRHWQWVFELFNKLEDGGGKMIGGGGEHNVPVVH